MKGIQILLALLTTLVVTGFRYENVWIIDAKSQLAIHGSTNLTNFTCKFDCYNGGDTLQFVKNIAACELQFSRNRMTIPVRGFDCGVRQISRDFWETLKSETYPELDISFRSLQDIGHGNGDSVKGIVDITLAGVTVRYTIFYSVTQYKNTILLKGNHPVCFSDFNLKAPEKLQGLIKVRETLNVEFNLVLTPV